MTPVRLRSSSAMSLETGTKSQLWRTMARYGVDLYVAGEVHDTTMHQANGITQISTGGLLYKGEATYMTAKVYGDRIEFDVREFDHHRSGEGGKLWQLGAYRTTGNSIVEPGSHSVGSMTLTSGHVAKAAKGKLVEYRR